MILNLLAIAMAFIAGLGMGLFYFGGLWLTVRQLLTTKHPFLLLIVSLLLRLGIVLGSLYLIVDSFFGAELIILLLACLLGFIIIRNILIVVQAKPTSLGFFRRGM
ncbi:MAG: ATP synthase subunit I [Moorea sp. SIO4E2]|uniref:ATP synthase subunit I n=1 Tax=Moorena sp. SIO4E2 TaxID=2607826 RepID=UPI0013B8E0D2|nr:ATP synthase subunit I [Moorena sp. SIO4E2]NEQ08176.1 ATP synthase subunit I [Moorena sp. SIO4E2]